MAAFADRVRSGGWTGHTGKRIRNIVNIGIGGSDLRQVIAYEALRAYSQRDLTFRFVSNVDGTDLIEALADLTDDKTQFIVCSKTFTTQETLANARAARDWVLAALKDEAAIADRINDLKRTTDLLTAELTNLDARLAEAAPVLLTDEELHAYVTGLRSVLTTRPLDEQRAFLGAWVRDIPATGKTNTIHYTVPGHIGGDGGDGSDGGGPAQRRGGRPARRADQRAAARVNQIRRVLATLGNSAPGASVVRTCQTSFTLVRPRRLTEGSGEKKKAKKPVAWRAREWRRMLDQGVYKSQSALARGEGVSTAAVSVALKGVR